MLCAEEHVRLATPEELGQAFSMRVAREDLEKLLGGDPEDEEVYGDDEGGDAEPELFDDLDDLLADWSGPEEVAYDMDHEDEEKRGSRRGLEGAPPPLLRRKRHKGPPGAAADTPHQVNMMKRAKTERSKAKQLEKEIPWAQIAEEVRPLFIEAERKQWNEHLQHQALEVMDVESSNRVRAQVPKKRILPSRYAYIPGQGHGEAPGVP